jgi:hypothetical protein
MQHNALVKDHKPTYHLKHNKQNKQETTYHLFNASKKFSIAKQ